MAKPPTTSLLEGDIRGHLVRLALPTMIGIILIIALNLVDTYFVGRLGRDALAAMSFTFPVVSLVMSIAMGLGIGSTSAISRRLGAHDEQAARRLVTHSMLLAFVVVALISTLGLASQDAVFRLLGADGTIRELLSGYMTIWYAGAVFLVVPMVGSGAMRAHGDAKTPMYVMAAAAIANTLLDPLFIFGWGPIPALGIEGAAIATLIARALTLALSLTIMQRKKMLDWHVPTWSELSDSWRQVLSVGLPAAISNALAPVATAIMTALLATYSATAVAAYGVASRVEGLMLIPAMALGAAMTPFVGQNWGGHQEDRVVTGLAMGRRFVLVWGAVAWAALFVGGSKVGAVFTDDPKTIELVAHYLWIVPLSYGASGLVSLISSVFNAIDRAIRATVLSATRSLLLAIPLAFLGAQLYDVDGIFVGIGAATILTALIASLWTHDLLEPKTPAVPVRKLRGSETVVSERIDKLLDELVGLRDISVAARPINTLGFYVRGYEIGHVHRDGKLDLHVPPPIHDALIADGKATHHRHRADSSWVTHAISRDTDNGEAVWLLRLVAALCVAGREAEQPQGLDDELTKLDASPRVRIAANQVMTACGRRQPTQLSA